MIADAEAKLKKGTYESLGFFEEEGTEIAYTEEELNGIKFDLECWQQRIEGATLV